MFPSQFSRSEEYNYFSKLKELAILTGENAIEQNDEKQKKIDEIKRWMQAQIRPKDVSRAEIEMERSNEEMCLIIRKHANVNVKEMTVFEFYTLLDLMKNKKL